MKIQTGSKLLFTGDSVTDAGRSRPVAEGLFNPLGQGYPNIVSGMLTATYPERMIRVVNMGCSGNTSRDLLARWQTDTLDLKPDWLCIMIGVNDVWRQFDVPYLKEAHVPLDEYEKNLDAMIVSAKEQVKGGIVLMTPYYIENNPADAMRAAMDKYGAVCKKLAEKYGLLFVDTQAVFNRLLEHCHSSYIAWDRVHPNYPGHTALAKAFLKVIDFDFND